MNTARSHKIEPSKYPSAVRSDLLQAALEEFAERGFEGATVRQIAQRVGMAHSAIRHHYKTKEKLWFAAIDFLFLRLEQDLAVTTEEARRMADGDKPLIRDFLRKYVWYCARHPEHARIMYQESVSMSDRAKTVAETHLKRNHMEILPVLKTLKRTAGLPDNTPNASVIYLLTGACQNVFALASESKTTLGYDALKPESIEAHAQAVIALFCP